jgi:hypothetical protein
LLITYLIEMMRLRIEITRGKRAGERVKLSGDQFSERKKTALHIERDGRRFDDPAKKGRGDAERSSYEN